MEYRIHDLERVVGYREKCQRQISSLKQQIAGRIGSGKTGEFSPDNFPHGRVQ